MFENLISNITVCTVQNAFIYNGKYQRIVTLCEGSNHDFQDCIANFIIYL